MLKNHWELKQDMNNSKDFFRDKGCFYKKVKSNETFVIYSLQYEECSSIIGFDVFLIKSMGIALRDPDSYWGIYAWSFNTLEKAEKFCEERLCQR